MPLWESAIEKGPNLTRLWLRLDREVRLAAAKALYEHDWKDHGATVMQADAAIAGAIRFRPVAVRKLPTEERVRYLGISVRPDSELVSALLTGLHFEERRDLMAAYLDALAIPHDNGLIDEEHEVEAPEAEKLSAAVDTVFGKFPEDHVELYLATLYCSDPDTWGGLVPVMEARRAKSAG